MEVRGEGVLREMHEEVANEHSQRTDAATRERFGNISVNATASMSPASATMVSSVRLLQ
jgi:hypothetical protein